MRLSSAADCQSWSEARACTFAPCWKDCFPGRSARNELRDRLRRRMAASGSSYLHRILRRLDPATAAKIHANDAAKLIRAIEVCLASRARISELWQQRGRDPLRGFRILRIGLNPPRDQLYDRINLRARKMFANGLVEETQALLGRYGKPKDVTPLDSLGYRQATQFLRGEFTLEQAIVAAQQGHRNYAKRQMTWFRREPEVVWLEGFGDDRRPCATGRRTGCRAPFRPAARANLMSLVSHRDRSGNRHLGARRGDSREPAAPDIRINRQRRTAIRWLC